MPDATITSTASTFGTISGTFAADQSTIVGTVTGIVAGTLDGSVGVPGPAGPAGAGVPAGGTAGQYLQKVDGVDYNTDWVTLNLSAYAPLNSPVFTGDPQAPTAALGDNDTSLATTAFVQQELASGVAVAKNLEVYVRNQTGSSIPAGSIVYISGATGNKPLITLAQANNDANSAQTMGFTKTAIANNGFGYVIVRGELENIDTSALTEGAQLYLSPTVAGTWTTTKPSAPQHLVYVGIVVRAHPTQGIILVAVQNGYELNELHDVAITSPTNGQVLKYNSSTNLWVNDTDVGGVAWGGITGTLSDQTDLQTALDGKYDATNPAGFITSSDLSPYLLSSTAATTYYLQTNPAGFITSAALTGYATESFVTSQGYITSAALTPYLTSATAASTYQTLAGMSSYLTSATAASTYQTLAGMSSYALNTDGALKGNFTLDGTASSPNSDGSILIGSSSVGYNYLSLQAGIIQGVTYASGNKTFTLNGLEGLKLFSSGQGVRFPDATTQTTAYPGSGVFALLSGDTFTGKVNFTPSASLAGINIGTSASAPSTLSNGDLWIGDNLNYRNQSGATRTVINAQTPNTITVNGVNAPLTLNQAGSGAALAINNTGTGSSLIIDNGTPDVAFTVNADGRVGVGTAPDATAAIKLDAGGIKFNDGTTQTTAPIADAPSDGTVYGRQNGSWVNAETDQVNVQTFGGPSSSGTFTWTKPVGAKWVEVLMIGAGGGGGSGARYATTSARYGGGGGGGGSVLFVRVHADDLASTETVTVGAGGQGGAATTTNAQPGTTGTSGTDSSFGPYFASGGPGGNRGTTSAAAAVGSRFVLAYAFAGSVGNGGAGSGAASSTLTYQYLVAPSGGGGGASALASSTTDADGGAGGGKAAGTSTLLGLISAVSGGAGGIASSSTAPTNGVATSGLAGGTGGGGGYYKTAVIGTAGGNGAFPGGGGGGGGASDNGFNSGAGGNGGNAFIVITTYCV